LVTPFKDGRNDSVTITTLRLTQLDYELWFAAECLVVECHL
jgi:hypothetical protein